MKKSIIFLAVLVAASTQVNAHPLAEEHKHGLFEGIVEQNMSTEAFKQMQRSQKLAKKYRLGDPLSPQQCIAEGVGKYLPMYDNCMYAHRDDLAKKGPGVSYIRKKCERTACDPSWLDKLRYK